MWRISLEYNIDETDLKPCMLCRDGGWRMLFLPYLTTTCTESAYIIIFLRAQDSLNLGNTKFTTSKNKSVLFFFLTHLNSLSASSQFTMPLNIFSLQLISDPTKYIKSFHLLFLSPSLRYRGIYFVPFYSWSNKKFPSALSHSLRYHWIYLFYSINEHDITEYIFYSINDPL